MTSLSYLVRVGLEINERKPKIMRMNTRQKEAVQLEGNDINDVEEFTYLGAIVSKEGEEKET